MKKYSYCGKQYGDDAIPCAVDGQPLTSVTEQTKPQAAKPPPTQHSQPPQAQWAFSFGRAFGWALPVLAVGLAPGATKWIVYGMPFNDKPFPLILVIGLAIVAFILGGQREKTEIPDVLVPVGRIGRGMWFLRNLAYLFGAGLLVAPVWDKSSDGAALWGILLGCTWIYLTIVNAGKRLHDLNVSARFSFLVFIPLVPLFMLILGGTKGPNKYGTEP